MEERTGKASNFLNSIYTYANNIKQQIENKVGEYMVWYYLIAILRDIQSKKRSKRLTGIEQSDFFESAYPQEIDDTIKAYETLYHQCHAHPIDLSKAQDRQSIQALIKAYQNIMDLCITHLSFKPYTKLMNDIKAFLAVDSQDEDDYKVQFFPVVLSLSFNIPTIRQQIKNPLLEKKLITLTTTLDEYLNELWYPLQKHNFN